MYKFTTIFSSILKPLVSEEKDKYLSLASLEEIGKYIPQINTDKSPDLLPVAFNACVVNRVNKNGDVIDSSVAASIYTNFINKPINIEHNRKNVAGVILTAGFSEFGSDIPLTLEQIKDKKEPFNVTLGGVIWKIVDKDLANIIEDSNDPSSDNYLSVSASWELGYSTYEIAAVDGGDKNIENAKIISDPDEIEKLKPFLKGFGGSGKDGDTSLYRKIVGNVIPLGIGLTTSPAADVKGVSIITPETEKQIEQKSEEISQSIESTVIKERINMKITKVDDITDELLKEAKASDVSLATSIRTFIAEKLAEVSETYVAEKAAKEKALQESQEKFSALSTDAEKLKTEFEAIKSDLEKLQQEKSAKEEQEKFDTRFASIDEEFELSKEEREIIANELKTLTTEDAYAAYKAKLAVLMKEKSKAFKAEQAKANAEKAAAAAASVKASVEDVVENAIDKGAAEKVSVGSGIVTPTETLKDKMKRAFAEDQFIIVK